jgi:hypothetical protein
MSGTMSNKNPSDWQEEDLLGLIHSQTEESLILDYKASPSLDNTDERKNEISKDVSSFANSAGGTIVYGISENGGIPKALDGQIDPTKTTKEWLEQVIHGRIRPRLDVHINPVALTTQHPGRVAYVVKIPPGKTAHQASDHKYYKRYNFRSVPMEDHEIRDVMNRSKHPIIEPIFRFMEPQIGKQTQLFLHVTLRNVGAMRAKDIKLVLFSPPDMFSVQHSQFLADTVRVDELVYTSYTFQRNDLIIFPDDAFRLTDHLGPLISTGKVSSMDILLSPIYELRWKVYADDMPPKEGKTFLKNISASS